MNARARSKFKVDASEVRRLKYAALETEIRLLRELRSQVSSKLKKTSADAGSLVTSRQSDVLEVLVTKFRRRNFAEPEKQISRRSTGTTPVTVALTMDRSARPPRTQERSLEPRSRAIPGAALFNYP